MTAGGEVGVLWKMEEEERRESCQMAESLRIKCSAESPVTRPWVNAVIHRAVTWNGKSPNVP